MNAIKHLWFDFGETLAFTKREAYETLQYQTYADVVGAPVSPELIQKYKALYKTYKSSSAVFVSLDLSGSFWSDRVNAAPPETIFQLTEESVPTILNQLKDILPISVFSNTKLDTLLPALGIDVSWFTHRIGPYDIQNPKPALDGFYKMIELSGVLGQEILYIGDNVEKDLVPATKAGIFTGLLWKASDKADYCFKDFSDILV